MGINSFAPRRLSCKYIRTAKRNDNFWTPRSFLDPFVTVAVATCFDLLGLLDVHSQPLCIEARLKVLRRYISLISLSASTFDVQLKLVILFTCLRHTIGMEVGTHSMKKGGEGLRNDIVWQKAILDSADFTVISMDLHGTIVSCNAGTLNKLGYTADDIIGRSPLVFHDSIEVEQRIHELSEELDCSIAPEEVFTIKTSKGIFPDESDWTHICKDGKRFISHVSVTAIRDESGGVIGYLKIGKDVTKEREMEKALRDIDARFQAFMDYSPTLATIKDADGRYIFVNQPFLKEFGQTREAVIGHTLYDLVPVEFADLLRSHDKMVLQKDEYQSFEETFTMADGLTKTGLTFRFPLEDTSGNRLLGSVTIDITERKYYEKQLEDYQARLEAAIEKLEELASTDALSGLKNKGAFLTRLDEEIVRVRRDELPLSLVLLDVDKFKEFNDSFGHPAGDEVLKQIADILTERARTEDFVARIGGEEFAIILVNTPVKGAVLLGERVRRAVENIHWENRTVTISVGVAEATQQNPKSMDVYGAADKALYESKRSGRNQVSQSV